MERTSLASANKAVIAATQTFRRAAMMIRDGDTAGAQRLIEGLDDRPLRAHWVNVDAVPSTWGVRPRTAAYPGPLPGPRAPAVQVVSEMFVRDGWKCRWCGTPVIAQHALKRMHLVFPMAFPRGTTDAARHALLLAAGATPDHVLPRSCGGSHHPENLVTACWPCQFARGDYTLEQLGLTDPRLRPPVVDDWDGVAWFRI